jgi:hypothetical protein
MCLLRRSENDPVKEKKIKENLRIDIFGPKREDVLTSE